MSARNLTGQKILVTGAGGFIGSHLCRRLRNDNEIHGVSTKKRARVSDGVCWWQGDLADEGAVRNIFTAVKPDVIFHLASHVMGSRNIEHVMPTFRSSVMSTVNLLSVAAEMGCRRMVLAGSLEECEPGSESIPSSPYAAAKWAGSGYARMFHALYELPVVILRVFMVYGPGQQDLSKLIPYVTLSLLRDEAPKLTSGRREIDWIYVDDVVEGLLAAASASGVEGRTIDVGSGRLASVRSVVEHLVRLIKPRVEPVFGAIADRPLEQIRVANVEDAYARMGWKPAMSLPDGLERTVHWYRNHAALAAPR